MIPVVFKSALPGEIGLVLNALRSHACLNIKFYLLLRASLQLLAFFPSLCHVLPCFFARCCAAAIRSLSTPADRRSESGSDVEVAAPPPVLNWKVAGAGQYVVEEGWWGGVVKSACSQGSM